MSDNILHPAHYEVYPVQPIEITRHLNFCLGNALKYALRAPFKNGVEDCKKGLRYLEWQAENGLDNLAPKSASLGEIESKARALFEFFRQPGDDLWLEIALCQFYVINGLLDLLGGQPEGLDDMRKALRDLAEALALRDACDPAYAGMSGLPCPTIREGE